MKLFQKGERLMGSYFSFGVLCEYEEKANQLLELAVDEVRRLEQLLSEFLESSDVSRLNRACRFPVSVSKECFGLLKRSLHLSQLTNGDFDITIKPMKQLYSFRGNQFEFPTNKIIQNTLKRVGFQNIILNDREQTVSFKHEIEISFAGIGKGFASDCVKNRWLEKGVKSGFVNASGDLNAFGQKPSGQPWMVGIANPEKQDELLLSLPVNHAAIATSGDYEQFFEYEGKRYSHTIHPKTGKPVQSVKSVSVYSPSAELSDALATAVFVKGVKDGLAFINQLPQTHCVIVNNKNQVYFSNELKYEEISPDSDWL